MSGGVVVVNQPGVYLVDADGNVLTANDGTTIASHEGLLVCGKDGTVLRFMRVASDGTLRIDPTGTTTQPISAATLPLPTGAATEAKLEAVRALVVSLDGKDFATQTTLATLATETKLEAVRVLLASLDGKDFATQTTLAAVLAKQTDRLQKTQITNGTIDAAVIADNSINRLESRSTVVGQVAKAGAEAKVTTIADPDNPATEHRLQTEAKLAPGSKVSIIPAAAGSGGDAFRQYLTDDGLVNGDPNMRVDGSVTPKPFWFPAHATLDTVLTEVRFTFSAFQFDWSGAFGKGGGLLTNGIYIVATVNGGTVVNFASAADRPIKQNEDLLMLPARNSVILEPGGNRDVMALSIDFGGVTTLEAGSGDEIRVTINDDLTTGARDITFLQFAAYGVRMTP